MLIKFKNLGPETTFDEFRNAYIESFGFDFYLYTDPEEIPTGKISDRNDEWVSIENNVVVVFEDSNDDDIIIN